MMCRVSALALGLSLLATMKSAWSIVRKADLT